MWTKSKLRDSIYTVVENSLREYFIHNGMDFRDLVPLWTELSVRLWWQSAHPVSSSALLPILGLSMQDIVCVRNAVRFVRCLFLAACESECNFHVFLGSRKMHGVL